MSSAAAPIVVAGAGCAISEDASHWLSIGAYPLVLDPIRRSALPRSSHAAAHLVWHERDIAIDMHTAGGSIHGPL
jgi:hypothetical protein